MVAGASQGSFVGSSLPEFQICDEEWRWRCGAAKLWQVCGGGVTLLQVKVAAQFVVSARFCDGREWRKMVVARRGDVCAAESWLTEVLRWRSGSRVCRCSGEDGGGARSGGFVAAAWWSAARLVARVAATAAMVMEGEEKIRVRVLGDEDDDVAESDWLIW
ncbi:hypothetical protein DEO72_LG3g670 [Vigna unguiculata]|uniref:Uncharacterized protein n=1 Tax=Vigna unguiculata TaxID=3917 RepID=A0A4D6LC65_VIGUN|nr:hypothetical protein DEO72_LG3g670 [Vigna unguiculata]